jgi:hypothetical protein
MTRLMISEDWHRFARRNICSGEACPVFTCSLAMMALALSSVIYRISWGIFQPMKTNYVPCISLQDVHAHVFHRIYMIEVLWQDMAMLSQSK